MADVPKTPAGEHAEHVDQPVSTEKSATVEQVSVQNLEITTAWWKNSRAIIIALILNTANFQYGLDQGEVAGFQSMPGFLAVFGSHDSSVAASLSISTQVQQLITSLVPLGMFVSTIASGSINAYIGRRGGVWLGSALTILSIVLQMACTTRGGLYIGRLFLGMGNGLLIVSNQLFMQETIPANLRSLNFTFFQMWISIGSIIGSVVNNYTSTRLDRLSYQIPLAITLVIPVLLSIALIFMPDTPRFYAIRDGNRERAQKALRWFRDSAITDTQVEEELAEICHALEVDLEMSQKTSFFEILKPVNLKRTLTAVGIVNFAAGSGSIFVTSYGVYLFELSGDTHAFRDVIILLCVGLIGVSTTIFFTTRVGKRIIFMVSAGLQGLAMLGIGLAYTTKGPTPEGGHIIVAMTCIYIFVYAASLSPFSWQVAGEIPSLPLRAHTLGLAAGTGYFAGWLLTFTAPYFINPTALDWGPQYAYIWVPTNFLIIVFVFFCVPETNMRTLEEIDECYNHKVPIRKFPSYDCVESKQARQQAVLHHKEQ